MPPHSPLIAHTVQRGLPLLPGVKNTLAVGSGKGGVGKSTLSVNLALALARTGARVGVLDADIYGPSLPTMLGLGKRRPESPDGKSLRPLIGHGLQMMSIGCLLDSEQAAIWRGPMATQALLQLTQDTRWDALDYLLIDLPPGTGDIQLTLAQKIPVTGAVVVSTPQEVALADARRAAAMFSKVGIPVLGLVENMATHVCRHCGQEEAIFGEGGGERLARELDLPLLGRIPLDAAIQRDADRGLPTVAADPEGPVAQRYQEIARRLAERIAQLPRDYSGKIPKVVTTPAGAIHNNNHTKPLP